MTGGGKNPRVAVLIGSGGVGKTTTAAALAVGLAGRGLRTVVLTIDPAKRLAQALGLDDLGGDPQPVPGLDGLHALMLDQDVRFAGLLAESGAPELADHRVTATVARSFGGLQEYLAMDLLSRLHDSGEWDAIVVDTPPALSALDFLDSAERVRRLVRHPLMRLLTSSSALVGSGVAMLGNIVGSDTLRQVAAWARGIRPVADTMLERSSRMRARLGESGEFLVVTAAGAEALREARTFTDSLADLGIGVDGVVVNRTHPVPEALAGADLDWDAAAEKAASADEGEGPAGDAGRDMVAALRLVHESREKLAAAEERQIGRFRKRCPDARITKVPSARGGVATLDDLRELSGRILPALDG